ncbi:MAG TPA: YbaN family protein [Bacteroidales bacterium]|nr:YbaN family protein [Bacteroidales bacterium]
MFRFLLIAAGSLSLGLGVLGIFVPGLPTTVFLLGAAACYVRSSDKLYNWMLQHKVLGVYIRNYRKYRAMPLKSKIIALVMMWSMIGLSVGFFIDNYTVKIIVIVAGLIGTTAILLVKTLKKEMKEN